MDPDLPAVRKSPGILPSGIGRCPWPVGCGILLVKLVRSARRRVNVPGHLAGRFRTAGLGPSRVRERTIPGRFVALRLGVEATTIPAWIVRFAVDMIARPILRSACLGLA